MLQMLFFGMVLFHIIDDFCLQSFWLVNGKQKSWWKENAPDALYRHDYIVALLIHSLSWAIMIMVPWFLYAGPNLWSDSAISWVIIFNTIVHAIVDDLKANRHAINLVTDQVAHFAQIIITCSVGGVLWYPV